MSDRLTFGPNVAVRPQPSPLRVFLTLAAFRIRRKDLFEVVKQPKIDEDIMCLLPNRNSYTGSVDGVVCFV